MFFSISSVDELLICIHVPSCWIFWQFQLFKRWYFFWEGLSVSWRFISKLQWFTGRPVCLVAICHKNMNIEFFARGCLLLLNKIGAGIYYLWTSLLFLKVIKLRSFARSLWIDIQMTLKTTTNENKNTLPQCFAGGSFYVDVCAILALLLGITEYSDT